MWAFSSFAALSLPSENRSAQLVLEIVRLTVGVIEVLNFQHFAGRMFLVNSNLASIGVLLIYLVYSKQSMQKEA